MPSPITLVPTTPRADLWVPQPQQSEGAVLDSTPSKIKPRPPDVAVNPRSNVKVWMQRGNTRPEEFSTEKSLHHQTHPRTLRNSAPSAPQRYLCPLHTRDKINNPPPTATISSITAITTSGTPSAF